MHRTFELAAAAAALLLSVPCAAEEGHADPPPRAVLGVTVVTVPPGLEDVVGTAKRPGAFVIDPGPRAMDLGSSSRDPYSLPEKALYSGDLIVELDGRPVRSARELDAAVSAKAPGAKVQVRFVRDGQERLIEVVLGEGSPRAFLPARVCAVPTAGAVIGLNLAAGMFFGSPLISISQADLAGECPAPLDACRPLALRKQTPARMLVEINGTDFQIPGDWRAHTHWDPQSCLDEQRAIQAAQAAREKG